MVVSRGRTVRKWDEKRREDSTKVEYSMARVIAPRHVGSARCKCDREKDRGEGQGRRGSRRKRSNERGATTIPNAARARIHARVVVDEQWTTDTPRHRAISPIHPRLPVASHSHLVPITLRFRPSSRSFPRRYSVRVSRVIF